MKKIIPPIQYPETGEWSPERRALHERLIQGVMKEAGEAPERGEGENKQIWVTGGLPGAGKSSVLEHRESFPEGTVRIDSDKIKTIGDTFFKHTQNADGTWLFCGWCTVNDWSAYVESMSEEDLIASVKKSEVIKIQARIAGKSGGVTKDALKSQLASLSEMALKVSTGEITIDELNTYIENNKL